MFPRLLAPSSPPCLQGLRLLSSPFRHHSPRRLAQLQLFAATARNMTASDFDLSHYFADSPPSVVRLEIEKHFEPLNDKQKRYAHFISQ